MYHITHRTGSALFLLALLTGCTDAVPTSPALPARGVPEQHSTPPALRSPYRTAAALVPETFAAARAAALRARAEGASQEEAIAAADAVVAVAVERLDGSNLAAAQYRAKQAEAQAVATPGQLRYMARIQEVTQDLGPRITMRELDRRLGMIEHDARRELGVWEAYPILMATAAVAEMWRASAPQAHLGIRTVVSESHAPLYYRIGDGWDWGDAGAAIAWGAFTGSLSGAIGGAAGGGLIGAAWGTVGGALGGAVVAGLDYWRDCCLF